MIVREAAKELGVTPAQIRYLIRNKKIKAKTNKMGTGGFYYTIPLSEVKRLKGKIGYEGDQTSGYPRGRKRK